MNLLRTFLGGGVLLLGCESEPERSPLPGTPWELVTLNGQAPIPTPRPLTAEFLPSGILRGFGGINTFEVGYAREGKWISLQRRMESTLKGSLVPTVEDQESAFKNAIGRTRSYFISADDLLHLCDAAGNELLILRRSPR